MIVVGAIFLSSGVVYAANNLYQNNNNVGVGTTSPYNRLSVVGTSTAAQFEATTTATSTANGGWNVQAGCFAIRSVCVGGSSGGSGTVNSGIFGQATYYGANGTAVSGTTTIVVGTTTADANNVGIGTSTPLQKLSVQATTAKISTSSIFSVASTTGRSMFSVSGDGSVITTSPYKFTYVNTDSFGLAPVALTILNPGTLDAVSGKQLGGAINFNAGGNSVDGQTTPERIIGYSNDRGCCDGPDGAFAFQTWFKNGAVYTTPLTVNIHGLVVQGSFWGGWLESAPAAQPTSDFFTMLDPLSLTNTENGIGLNWIVDGNTGSAVYANPAYPQLSMAFDATDATTRWYGSVGCTTFCGTQTMILDYLGNLTAEGDVCSTAYGQCLSTVSDQRVKKNITPISSALSSIMQLNPVSFNWNAVYKKLHPDFSTTTLNTLQYGLIAQDVKNVFPNIVGSTIYNIPNGTTTRFVQGTTTTINGKTTTTQDGTIVVATSTQQQLYDVKYSELVPVLIKAIQEQQAEITDLQNRLTAAGIK